MIRHSVPNDRFQENISAASILLICPFVNVRGMAITLWQWLPKCGARPHFICHIFITRYLLRISSHYESFLINIFKTEFLLRVFVKLFYSLKINKNTSIIGKI
jgi:hypothetical protein